MAPDKYLLFDIKFWVETAAVFLVFAALASTSTPDINETHYLTKAKHFWNPHWCAGDLFLESANAHYVFFILFGWPSLFLSLDAFAWLGRLVCWIGMAVVWVRLSRALLLKPFVSVVTAAFFVLLTSRFDMAGEWVIGGFEAKSVAYIFVVWAVELFIRRQPLWFWPVLGSACAFHAVIGSWALVCFTIAASISSFRLPGASLHLRVRKFSDLYLPVGVFTLLAGTATFPLLLTNWTTSPATLALANEIQVHQRLAHHLLFGSFHSAHVARFAVIASLWFFCTQIKTWSISIRMLNWFCGASLLISLVGLVLSGMAEQTGPQSNLAHSLLRFYWFRFSDFAIPLGLALMSGQLFQALLASESKLRRFSVLICALAMIAAVVADVIDKQNDLRPPAAQASMPFYQNNPVRTKQSFENWKKACQWIRQNTAENSLFLSPTEQQTFKWYAQRAEVACWKDAPQDATGIMKWFDRIYYLRRIEQQIPGGLLGLTDTELTEIARRFAVTHLLVPQSQEDLLVQQTSNAAEVLSKVYPADNSKRSTYVVYEVNASPSVSGN